MPAMVIADTTRVVASDDALVREVNGEAVLLNLTTSQYHVLDPASTEMWHALLTAGSFAAAVEAIHADFDVERAVLRADLERFVQQLVDRGLVRLEPV
jgi:Coenzyme PQQ synthesis protein D (PqqD)